MRRIDKEITDKNEIINILRRNVICHLALSEEDNPYIVPMNYGYDNGRIYLHCAQEGRKLDIIAKNNKVCFEVSESIKVQPSSEACKFTTKYRSVIGFGKVFPVLDPEEKMKVINIIMRQHTGRNDWMIPEDELAKIRVLSIEIESISGKSSY